MTRKYTLLLLVAIVLVACGKKSDDAGKKDEGGTTEPPKADSPAPPAPAEAPAPVAMAPVDIAYEDFQATMQAPEGATFEEKYGTLEVKVGDGATFFVQIDTDAPDMAEVKSQIEGNDVQKLIKFHTESPDTFVYETEVMGKRSFWLDTAVTVGDTTVHCYSGRGAHSYTKAQIATFEKACKSLAPKS